MAHIIVAGLRGTIETPKGDIRRGVDRNGARWHVHMPAAYGYIRGFGRDHDGDLIDAYYGPESWCAEEHPVWVVDQIHLHNHQFDEHKCMIGFSSSEQARDTYYAGFSDGHGPERAGAVTRMSFMAFKQWLRHGNHTKPLAYRQKSASTDHVGGPYGDVMCPCARCQAIKGARGDMTEVSEPKALGVMTGLLARILPRMTVEEKAAMMADASVLASTELGKAGEFMEGVSHVRDHWSGTSTGVPTMVSAHGPGSSAAPGSVNVGPTLEASGAGLTKQEGAYSQHEPQHGAQHAAERLGAELNAVHAAVKAILKAHEGFTAQLALLGAAGGTSEATVKTMVSKAVSEAMVGRDETFARMVRKAVKKAVHKASTDETDPMVKALRKAEDEEKESEESDEKEEGEGTEVEITNEVEAEDEDDKDETKKSLFLQTARLRLMAKSRIAKAKKCIEKAQGFVALDQPAIAKAYRKAAGRHLAKAESRMATAYTVHQHIGPSSKAIAKSIKKLRKARKSISVAQNQDKWPNKGGEPTGKSETSPSAGAAASVSVSSPGAAVAASVSPDLTAAIDKINKAAAGVGLLTASVQEFMAVAGSQVSGGTTGNGERLPPTFALAKANGDTALAIETDLAKLHDDNVITFDQWQNAREVLAAAKMTMPEEFIRAKISRLPEPAQKVLNRHAA